MTSARTTAEADAGKGPGGPRPPGGSLSRVFPLLGVPGGRAVLLLLAATGVLGLVFAVSLVEAILRVVSAGPPAEPAIEARFRWREPGEVRLGGEGAPVADAPPPGEPDAPDAAGTVVRWREEEKLRRVAGILLLDGDYEGAIEILLQIKGEDSRAFALDRAAHARILAGLGAALLREREALGAFLEGLTEREQARARALLGPEGERFLALGPEDVHLPECARALPEGVALCFMRNVHVRLCRGALGSDALAGLVLGLGFRQGSDAARVYREEFPREYTPYAEAFGPGRNRDVRDGRQDGQDGQDGREGRPDKDAQDGGHPVSPAHRPSRPGWAKPSSGAGPHFEGAP